MAFVNYLYVEEFPYFFLWFGTGLPNSILFGIIYISDFMYMFMAN
jgi:hypothetical protein